MTCALDKELPQKAEAIVREAGSIILGRLEQPKDIYHKGRIDLVTNTDLEVEKQLQSQLSIILPQASFLSEESMPTNKLNDLTWVIDPLDGTTNFAHGLFPVAISVALWQKDQIVLGLVYIPKTHEMFTAVKDAGAFLNGRRIRVSPETYLENSLIATGFPYDIDKRLEEIIQPLQNVLPSVRGIRRMGAAAIDLAYTACGRFEGFYELGLKPWDTAAGWLLVLEAGGAVTELNLQNNFNLYSPSIMATNSLIHYSLGQILTKK